MPNKLVLIRGLPGSGKSTRAKNMQGFYHVEADMWFIRGDGTYQFVPEQVGRAHAWCQATAAYMLEHGENIVVSNTFSRKWELEPYIKMAEQLGCELDIVCCKGEYGNIHNVPQQTIDKMKARWEDIPGEIVIQGVYNEANNL